LTDPCYAKELEATIDPLHASSSKTVRRARPILAGILVQQRTNNREF